MNPLYKSISALLLLTAIAPGSQAQNTPVLTQTSPTGTVLTAATVPPAFTVTPYVYNYVRSFSPRVAITDAASLTITGPASQAVITTDFKDGFNRTIEVVQHNYTEGKSLVRPVDTRYQQLEQGFLPYSHNSSVFRSNAFSEQQSYYSSLYPGEGATAVSRSANQSTATERARTAYQPGKSQTGQNRGLKVKQLTNTAGSIRIWTVNASGLPERTGTYAAGQLFAEEATDVAGGRSISYKDRDGNLVYKSLLTEGSTEAITQYIYDDKGRLCYILPPEASYLSDLYIPTILPESEFKKLWFRYRYDDKGRLSGEQKPGEDGFTELVYDRKDRVVMRRSPLEAAQGKWEITFYDKNNRVIATSLYGSSQTQAYWQGQVDGLSPTTTFSSSNLLHYMATNGGEGQYPGTISGNEVMSYSYYDHYGYSGGPFDMTYSLASMPEAPAGTDIGTRSTRTQGMLTGSRVRTVKAGGTGTELGDWIESVVYYDDKGRVMQQRSRNATKSGSTAGLEMACTWYDFRGKPLLTAHYHENKKTGHAANEYTRYVYDESTGRLTESAHKVNEGTWRKLNSYEYNDLGQVSRKVLGNNAESQAYSYNIRGQLTGINGNYAETGDEGGQEVSFGESLKYDYGYSSARYDGKITGMVWRGSGGKAKSYGYDYDLAGRLKRADFRELSGSTWSNTATDYSVPRLSYDRNGNIQAMMQRGMGLVGSSIVPVDMDRLAYSYEGNRLMAVKDTITTNYNIGDFIDGYTAGNDYAYDASGNLEKDLNKGIASVSYTFFNKPQTVTFSNGNTITYTYDAGGNKLQEKVTIGSTIKTTDYVGNFIYENDVLQYVSTGEGRAVYDPATGDYNEEFFVKDHLGNVRSVVEVQPIATTEYLATYEVASAELEGLVFDRVSEIAAENPESGDPGNLQSGMLNGSTAAGRIGTSLLLRVMAGDKVEMNVNSFYNSYNPATDAPVSASTMLSSITSTLTGGAGGWAQSEAHNPQLVGQLFSSNNYTVINNIINSDTDPSKPRAYLNYVLFDEQMQVVASFSGAFQANGAGTWGAIGTEEPLAIPVNGYLAVYLSDESTQTVYFDQLTVQFGRGRLLEETHYYPHGLPMGNIGSSAAGFKANRRKYQGNEYIKEAGLNWMDFQARQYDPQLGRFLGVDPLAAAYGQDMYSPYAAMGNEPEGMIDPNGESFESAMTSSWTARRVGMDIAGGFWISPTLNAIMDQAAWGWGESGKSEFSWGGMSGQQLRNYIARQPGKVQAIILGEIFQTGAFVCNLEGAGGGSKEEKKKEVIYGPYTIEPITITKKLPNYSAYHRAAVLGYSPILGNKEGLHLTLDAAGLVPGLGEPFDILNGVIYQSEGDYVNAGFSYGSAIPFLGYGFVAAKYGNKLAKGGKTLLKFGGDEAVSHFAKHGTSVMNALGETSYSLKNYINDANSIINNGTYIPQLNGYIRLIGGTGSAKFGFVGMNRATGNITTFHIKTIQELSKKAPNMFGL